jgi:hypothetical protein
MVNSLIAACSSGAHPGAPDWSMDGGRLGVSFCRERLSHRQRVGAGGGPKGPHQRAASHGELEAVQIAVQVGTSTRKSSGTVRNARIPDQNDSQQVGLSGANTTSDTGSHRMGDRTGSRRHCTPSTRQGSTRSGDIPSPWMSMRQPVSRAARRAF